jgi:hypothetical protein
MIVDSRLLIDDWNTDSIGQTEISENKRQRNGLVTSIEVNSGVISEVEN